MTTTMTRPMSTTTKNRRGTVRSGHSGERYAYALVAFCPGFLKRSARRLPRCGRWLAHSRRVRRLSAEERLGDERPTVSQAPVVDSGSYRGRSDREYLPRTRDAMADGESSRSRAQWVTNMRRMVCLAAISFRPYYDLLHMASYIGLGHRYYYSWVLLEYCTEICLDSDHQPPEATRARSPLKVAACSHAASLRKFQKRTLGAFGTDGLVAPAKTGPSYRHDGGISILYFGAVPWVGLR